ncbi:MAG: tetraprenyl-beta-curcumene synthase family protein [Syntrophomonadaceae bacterium]
MHVDTASANPLRAESQYGKGTGWTQAGYLYHYIFRILPWVNRLLDIWREEAGRCADEELRRQAMASIAGKNFHCQGGAFLAVANPAAEASLVPLIVAYQTLCDYLDNLCDRAHCLDGQAFRQLHLSLLDALNPGGTRRNYYRYYPYRDDSGYIDKLVEECRRRLMELPSYHLVHQEVAGLANLYIDLQVKKHIAWEMREKTLIDWAQGNLNWNPGIEWNEFAAAAGSTLALFALLEVASRPDAHPAQAAAVLDAYFPWICGLHILLDYCIDQQEDREGGDLNFTFYYPSRDYMIERLRTFIREAHNRAGAMTQPGFAKTVIEGLLAMYFTDQKVARQGLNDLAGELLRESGRGARYTYQICRLVRKVI